MTRKTAQQLATTTTSMQDAIDEANELLASVAMPEAQETPTAEELAADAEIAEQIELPNSVVQRKYKLRYRDRARSLGLRKKHQKRSINDWMSDVLAAETLDKHAKCDPHAMAAINVANGVEEPDVLDENGQLIAEKSRWPSRSKGWEGRYRMTSGLALRTVVAEAGVMHLADGEELVAPPEWVAKYLR